MRTLVTGLNGFTGKYIRSELEVHGHTVIGLNADLTQRTDVAREIARLKPKMVVHLAGISYVNNNNSNAMYEVNLIGTLNLIEALAEYSPDVSSILLASSANVYGNRSEGVLSENSQVDPCNNYAVSKCAMEQMAKLWIEHLPIFVTRPFNYTGVWQDKNFIIPKIVWHFTKRSPMIELGNIDVWREFGDVRAVVGAYRRLLEICPVGQTLNVCTGKSYSLREVVALCEKITGHSIEIQMNPKFVRANEVRVLTGNNSRLKEVIGEWQTYNLEDTLRWMLQDSTVAEG